MDDVKPRDLVAKAQKTSAKAIEQKLRETQEKKNGQK